MYTKKLVIEFQEPNDIALVKRDIIDGINGKAFGRYKIMEKGCS